MDIEGTAPSPYHRRSARRLVSCSVAVIALFMVTLPASSASAVSVLTWEPPGYPDYSGFVTVQLAQGGNELNLDDGKDYRLIAPPVPITGHTNIRGGRNIVWIGGHTRIDWKGPGASAVSRRAITFRDNGGEVSGRTIHLEGDDADGSDLTEGINLAGPTAVVQIQNVRIARLVTRGSDDLNGQGAYSGASHPDVLQPWGGVKELRVNGLTGRSGYQHLWLLAEPVSSSDRVVFQRVNTEGISYVGADDGRTYSSHTGWGTSRDWTPQLFVDNGTVWHKSVGGTGTFESSFASDYETLVTSDALGTYAYNPTTAVNLFGQELLRNLDDTSPGRIYSGLPPGGDYVPKGTVGIGYVSSGYSTDPPDPIELDPLTTPDTLAFTPTDDAEIRKGSAGTNYGASALLTSDGRPVVDFLVKFTVSGVNGRSVSRAKLKLHNVDSSAKGGDLYSVGGAWSEKTVTWRNAPVSGASTIGRLPAVTAGSAYEVDLTSLVRADGTYAIRVKNTSSNASAYSSRESANPPQLILTVE